MGVKSKAMRFWGGKKDRPRSLSTCVKEIILRLPRERQQPFYSAGWKRKNQKGKKSRRVRRAGINLVLCRK